MDITLDPATALRELLAAIGTNAERRVVLDKRPGERRTVTVVMLRAIWPEIGRAADSIHLERPGRTTT